MKFFSTIKSVSNSNRLIYSGYLEVGKQILGPLEAVVEVNRCDPEMKKCEKNPKQHFKHICRRLSDKKAFYYNALSTLHPQLECPVKAQRYTATNSSVDLTPFTFLPISGYIWLVTLKLYSGEEKVKEIALCIELELKIVQVGRKRH